MLGEQIGETKGKRLVRRVISIDPPTAEVSFEDTGQILGIPTTGMGTYTSVVRPDGSIFGHGQGLSMTHDGEAITWTGTGLGKFGPGGSVSYRGMLFLQTCVSKARARQQRLRRLRVRRRSLRATPSQRCGSGSRAELRSVRLTVPRISHFEMRAFAQTRTSSDKLPHIGAKEFHELNSPRKTTIAPFLSVRNGAKAVDFYKAAFGAEVIFRHDDPDGAVVAHLSVNGAAFWVADESPDHLNFSPETLNGGTVRIILTTDDPDAAFRRAVAAGATVVRDMTTNTAGA